MRKQADMFCRMVFITFFGAIMVSFRQNVQFSDSSDMELSVVDGANKVFKTDSD